MNRWVAFFRVKQAREAMVFQHLVWAALQSTEYEPSDLEYLQRLDFERPAENPGELLKRASGQ